MESEVIPNSFSYILASVLMHHSHSTKDEEESESKVTPDNFS